MTRVVSMSVAAIMISCGATGCVAYFGEPGEHVDRVQGALGEVQVSGTPEIRELRVYDNELFVDLRIQDAVGNWAMVALTIPRDGSDEGLTSLSLRVEDAELLGCSGADEDDWDFDCKSGPGDLDVRAEDRADGVSIDFDGLFSAETCHDLPDDEPTQPVGGSIDIDLI